MVSIFTLNAYVDNPSKDVNWPYELVNMKSVLLSKSPENPKETRGWGGEELRLMDF